MMTETLTSGVRDGLGAVKDVDEKKREVLVTIPTEVLDTYNSDFQRDAFDEFLGQRLPVMCWMHNKQEPVGRATSWVKGARSSNDFVARFSDLDAVPRARQAFTQIRDGDITDFSFYFDQATAVPHPQERGAIRFTKARMPEISPVVVGSIPGAVVTGVRAASDAAGIAELVRARVVTEEEARQMLAGVWGQPLPPLPERERISMGARSVTITIGDDGTVTTSGDVTTDPAGGDGAQTNDPTELAQAVDAVLDQADDLLDGIDTSAWPAEAQQLVALVQAASVTADELLDAMNVPDVDEDAADGGDRTATPDQQLAADLATAFLQQMSQLGDRAAKEPYGDVEYADPGYQDDKQKRYPLDSEAHVRSALAYIGQADNAAKYSAEDLAKVKAKIHAAAKKLGIDVTDGSRSADDDLDVEAAGALAALNRHR